MVTAVQLPMVNARHRTSDPDYTIRWLAVIAGVVSIGAFFYFQSLGLTLAYKDAISHLDIARRVVDSPTSGLAQLGGVWLPLPHLLALFFIWSDPLYYSGFAGSVVSMGSYVVTSMLLYKIVYGLTGRKLAGVIAATVFMANPNVLYMQSTPMTELLMFASMAGLVYAAQQWLLTGDGLYGIAAGFAALLGILTRYETWVLLFAMAVTIGYGMWRKYRSAKVLEGSVLAFLFCGGVGIAMWMMWNFRLFGDPLYFQFGDYAKPSLWVGDGEAAVGNWWLSFLTYSIATTENLWPVVTVLMLAGLVAMVVRERLAPHTLPSLTLLVLFPFFVVALVQGQRPLHVAQIMGDYYNARFGLLMILPAAIAVGYLTTVSWRRQKLEHAYVGITLIATAFFVAGALLNGGTIVTLREPTVALQKSYSVTTREVSDFLHEHYAGGEILMESFGNDMVMFDAQISLRNNINEGSYQLWEPALTDPNGKEIHWIVMRHAGNNQSDRVYKEVYNTPKLNFYRLVLENDGYYVYERRTS